MKNAEDPKLNIPVRLWRKVRKAIQQWPENFNMSRYGDGEFKFNPAKMKKPMCGSSACLAGWLVAIGDQKSIAGMRGLIIHNRARGLGGLTREQANVMFAGYHSSDPEDAVKAIDRLLETGGRESWQDRECDYDDYDDY